MSQEVYKELLEVMKKRGGGYAGMDIPEFFEMVEEMFTPEEAEVNNAMPRGPFTAKDMAEQMGRDAFGVKRGALAARSDQVLCDQVLNAIATQLMASSIRKNNVITLAASLS